VLLRLWIAFVNFDTASFACEFFSKCRRINLKGGQYSPHWELLMSCGHCFSSDWIACVYGFFSTVKLQTGRSLIRARCEKDIQNLYERYRYKCPELVKRRATKTADYPVAALNL